jgi:alkaline phosphatase D
MRRRAGGRSGCRVLAAGLAVLVRSQVLADPTRPPELPQGIAIAEVEEDAAVAWGRCRAGASFEVAIDDSTEGATGRAATQRNATARVAPARAEHDHTARIELERLAPGTEHRLRARCVAGSTTVGEMQGRFRTAPAGDQAVAVRFAFGGDLGGQNVCRDERRGYPIFDVIAALRPDFFVALGDMIYADDPCQRVGRFGNLQVPGPGVARTRSDFWAHWRYNRSDPGQRRLLATVPYYAVWDDHEVANDFGPGRVRPGDPDPRQDLLLAGRDAFLDYNPIRTRVPEELYRSVRWGRRLELFLLDTRQHRSPNGAPDRAAVPKTLLGAKQRDWLTRALVGSDATWKIVVSSVPISIPTGSHARDGWADAGGGQGFERELRGILEELHRARVTGLVWITTDVHFATGFRYRPFPEDPSFELYELISGPLHAGIFPTREYDPSFAPERIFFHGPSRETAPRSLDQALGWLNFGWIEIAADGKLRARVIDATGATRADVTLPIRTSPAAGPPPAKGP